MFTFKILKFVFFADLGGASGGGGGGGCFPRRIQDFKDIGAGGGMGGGGGGGGGTTLLVFSVQGSR